jgi:hypothetical protein
VSEGISEKQWVGVDLHLHRSVICRIDERGRQLDCVQIDNDPKALVKAVRLAGRGAPVAVEATYGTRARAPGFRCSGGSGAGPDRCF